MKNILLIGIITLLSTSLWSQKKVKEKRGQI